MPIAVIDIVSQYEPVKEEILNDLLWYDVVEKKMHKWKGTCLVYSYVNGRMVASPKVEKRIIQKKGNNLNSILNWINSNEDLGIEIIDQSNSDISIAFSADNRDLVEDLMYSQRFRYEIKDA